MEVRIYKHKNSIVIHPPFESNWSMEMCLVHDEFQNTYSVLPYTEFAKFQKGYINKFHLSNRIVGDIPILKVSFSLIEKEDKINDILKPIFETMSKICAIDLEYNEK